MTKSWKTTAIGFACGVLVLVLPSMQSGQWPTLLQWCVAGATTFIGLFAKDHDVTGK